jgi:hypothetical protein
MAVRNSNASSLDKGSSGRPTNSLNDGTVLSLSLKYVGRLRGTDSGVEASVARDLEDEDAESKF